MQPSASCLGYKMCWLRGMDDGRSALLRSGDSETYKTRLTILATKCLHTGVDTLKSKQRRVSDEGGRRARPDKQETYHSPLPKPSLLDESVFPAAAEANDDGSGEGMMKSQCVESIHSC